MDTVQIQAQRAVLEINTQAAVLKIENHRPELRIKRDPPAMVIKRENPSFKVSTEGAANADELMPVLQLSDRFRSALPDSMKSKGSAPATSPAGSVADAAKEQNPLAEVQKQQEIQLHKAQKRREASEQQAQLVWDPGYIKIEWTDPVFEMEWDLGTGPDIHVEPYVVEVRIRNRPVLRIMVEEGKVRGASGNNVDQIV
ncbi:MAG: DUF6470 family protein [Bacillota bacterium]